MTVRFDRDTTVVPAGGGAFDVRIDPGWWIVAGPNGGYLAALVLRALDAAQGDAARSPRSLTIHFTSPPTAGPARVETTLERVGRGLTTVSGRLVQEGRLVALALAAFSKPRSSSLSLEQARMPEATPFERAAPLDPRIEIHHRYEHRLAIGAPPFSGGTEALCGGWIRLVEPRTVDACLAAAYTDSFPPALFSVLGEDAPVGGVPTIDLTVHFRQELPLPGAGPEDYTLAVFRSRVAREGFLEEDGELWSPDGVLLAQSRQLALTR